MRELGIVWPHLRRHRRPYLVGAVCLVATIALRLAIPHLIGDAIDGVRSALEGTAGAGDEEAREGLVRAAGLILGLALAMGVVRTASRLAILGNARHVAHDLRREVFAHLQRLQPSFYTRHGVGELLSRSVNDLWNVQGLGGPVLLYLGETALLYAFGITRMVQIDPFLTMVGLAPFPVFLWLARRQASVIQHGSRAAQTSLGQMSARVSENLSAEKLVKTLVLEERESAGFEERAQEYRDLVLRVTRARAVLTPLMLALVALSTVVVLAVGGPRVVRGDLTLGRFVEAMLYLQILAAPTGVLGFVISSVQRGRAALARVGEVLATRPAIADPERPREGTITGGAISVRGLTVTYDGGESESGGNGSWARRALEDVSLEVPAGGTLGIVGTVGSGKSTLARALARQLEVEPGRVFYDGLDVNELPVAEVRGKVGYVSQDTFLFSASLADNVAFGRPDATREAILRAAEAARLSQDLERLEDGLDTMLGEEGVNLSGGQRQRTAIARVLLVDPPVLVLDDAFSAVDAQTAEEILRGIAPYLRARTTVIVSHRVSTVRDADRIVVLEGGRIVEQGTHDELVAAGGTYAELDALQSTRDRAARELGIEDGRDAP